MICQFFHCYSPGGTTLLHNTTLKVSVASRACCKAIFEHGLPFDPRMMPCNFCDDISNSSGVIVLTDRHLDKVSQTDTAENNTTLAMLCCAGGNNINSLYCSIAAPKIKLSSSS